MRAYRFRKRGSIDDLELREDAMPRPGAKEVLVRVHATALNFRDLLVAWDRYPVPTLKNDVIPLSDGAGEIVAIGDGVTRVRVGDRVVANFVQRWIAGPIRAAYMGSDLGGSLDGMLAEYVVLSEEGVVKLPPHLSYVEAGSLACAGLSAWTGVTGGAPLEPGQTVLIQGTGGVSLFALQFAKLFGARVIATTSSEDKAARLRALGADEVINYVTTPDWDAVVRELTGGEGADRVVEVGGPGTIERSIRSLGYGGRIALVGFVSGFEGAFSPLALLDGRGLAIDAISGGNRRHFEAMLQAMAFHKVHPVIDRVFPFEDAKGAYHHLERRAHIGKVVIGVT